MIPITVVTDIDRDPWQDLLDLPPGKYLTRDALGVINRIGRLANGTEGGCSTVNVQITLDDGRVVVGQTTLKLIWNAILILKSAADREGEPQ